MGHQAADPLSWLTTSESSYKSFYDDVLIFTFVDTWFNREHQYSDYLDTDLLSCEQSDEDDTDTLGSGKILPS